MHRTSVKSVSGKNVVIGATVDGTKQQSRIQKKAEPLVQERETKVANNDNDMDLHETPPYDTIRYPNLSTTSIAFEACDHDQLHDKSTLITYPEIPPDASENASCSNKSHFFTPEVLPPRDIIVEEFRIWMSSMDGGGHPSDISQKAKWVVKKILESISLEECMEPDQVCRYFTSKQMKRELTASSTNVYLRYFSSFLAYMHQTYKERFPFSVHNNIEQRIHR